MIDRKDIYQRFFDSYNSGEVTTINDLKEKEFSEEMLNEEEMLALINFDRYRLSELNQVPSDSEFNARYSQLQILANLADYREFLKEEYFFNELL